MSCNCKHTRRQFLRTASMASMVSIYASPFLLELQLNSPPWRSPPRALTTAPWSASTCRAATTATAP